MAFNSNPGKQQFTASAGQTVFTFNFAIFANTNIKVYKTLAGAVANDTTDLLTLTTHYTVAINGTVGGTVTLLTGAGINDTITIARSLPISRATDYVTNGDLYADTLDADQDYQTYLTNDANVQLQRAIIVPESISGVSLSIPAPVSNSYLRWNAIADALENDTSIPDAVLVTTNNVALTNADVALTHADVTTTLGYLNDFKGRYYGALASDPTLDPLGASMGAGDLYFNTTSNSLKVFNGAVWTLSTATADNIGNTPSGLISSTTVQNAINELDTEKANSGYTNYRNRIVNGAMNVNQINGTTAVTPTTVTYVADLVNTQISQASKLTFQTVVDAPAGFKYSTKITVASQYSPLATDYFTVMFPIEGQNIIDFQLGTAGAVTINTSLYIKGAIAGTYSCSIRNVANTKSYVGTVTVGTSWSRVSINLVGATDGVWVTDNTLSLQLSIDLGSGSNFNTTSGAWQNGTFLRTAGSVTFVNQVAGSTLNITGIQLEKVPTGATQGTEYEWLSYDDELRRCQRYLPVISSTQASQFFGNGYTFNTTQALIEIAHNVPTRVPITGTVVSNIGSLNVANGAGAVVASSGLILAFGGIDSTMVTITGSGFTAGQGSYIVSNNSGFKLLLTGAQL